jgi:hypothetical protein
MKAKKCQLQFPLHNYYYFSGIILDILTASKNIQKYFYLKERGNKKFFKSTKKFSFLVKNDS